MKALVVDGYNAIHKIPRLEKLMDKNLAHARKGIEKLAKEYQRRCGGIDKICVVFDGRDELRGITSSKNIAFSRSGQGDKEIIRRVGELSKKYEVIVVSDDNFIRNNSRAQKAKIISISEFTSIVNEKRINKNKTFFRKIGIDDALEIDKELRAHWKV